MTNESRSQLRRIYEQIVLLEEDLEGLMEEEEFEEDLPESKTAKGKAVAPFLQLEEIMDALTDAEELIEEMLGSDTES